MSGRSARRPVGGCAAAFLLLLWCVAGAAVAQTPMSPQLPDSLPRASIYNLQAAIVNQNGEALSLDLYKGQPVLAAMFYGSCPHTCPLLIDTVRSVEAALTKTDRERLRVLLISIDPQRDTPQALRKLATDRRIDLSRWALTRADAATVRKVAAILNVQYRQLPDGEFNHSSAITLLSAQGEIVLQSPVLGHADPALIAAIVQSSALARKASQLRSH